MRHRISAALILLFLAFPAWADTINVPGDYDEIHDAVQNANPGDVVQVGVGTFSDVTHIPIGDSTFCAVIMRSDVTVRGSGQGTTVIEADSAGRVFHCE